MHHRRTLTLLLGGLLPAALLLQVGASSARADGDASGAAGVDARARVLGTKIETTADHQPSGPDWGHAVGVVDAPYDAVLKIVTDYERYDEFMPHFKQARVLSRRGDNALVYMEASILKNAATLWAQLKVKALPGRGTTRIVDAKMQKGNMDQFHAVWELTPVDGGKRTLVDFRIVVEPDLPLPNALFSSENKKAATKTIKALRKRALGTAVARR
ncbi:MAG: SRPBCC family protein [Myxococcales bacterium]|nr:SRPBCC family protein [Myxococcales bacterium]